MLVPCAFCHSLVDTADAVEVYVPHAVTEVGAIVRRLAWAHRECLVEIEYAAEIEAGP